MTLTALQEAFRYLTSREEKPYPLLAVIALEQVAFLAFIVVLVQEYVPEELGLGVAFGGYLVTTLGAAKLLAQAPLGWLADRVGYKGTLALGLGVAALVIAPLLVLRQPAAILSVAALYGISRAVVSPAVFAVIADTYAVDRRGRISALANLAFFLGFIAGGLSGIALAGFAPFGAAVAMGMAFNALAALVVLRFVREPIAHRPPRAGTPLALAASAWRGLLAPPIAMWALIVLTISIGLNLLTPIIGPFARDVLGLELHQLAPFLVPASLLGLLSIVPAGHLVDRMGRFPPLLGGLAVGALGLAATAYVSNPWAIMLLACPVMLAYTASAPAVGATMMDLSRRGSRGLVLGALTAVQGLGGTIGPSIGGNIYDAYGPTVTFQVSAVILGVAVALVLYYARWPGLARYLGRGEAA